MDKDINLHIKDGTFAHCEYSNNPLPPKQFAKRVRWNRSEPGPKDACVYTEQFLPSVRKDSDSEIAWLIEPRDLIPGAYEWVLLNQHLFKEIWTHDANLTAEVGHAKLIPFGGCWIDKEDQSIHPKLLDFSIIASGKNTLEGHKLRHSIVQSGGGRIDVYGNGYQAITDKIEGLKDYRYHFSVENCRSDYWFTEKLIDCFRTGTVPIYWGCPSIGDFFNTSGMVIFETLEELPALLKECTEENYQKMLPAIQDNFERAEKFILAEDWMTDNGVIS